MRVCGDAGWTGAIAVLAAVTLTVASARPALADEDKKDWQPTPPMPEKFDWIQLTSDEWLKGEIIAMYDDKLEFDSDELDLLEFDWEDVRQVRSAQTMHVGFLHGRTATGKLFVDGDTVRVIGADEEQFDRSELLTITAGEPKEINYWSGKVTLGANIREGNTQLVEYNGSARFQRRTVRDRIVFDYMGIYNVTDDVLAADNHRASAGWDKFINDKLFVKPVFAEYYSDPFQNIGSRATIGVGVGYQIFDTPKTDWEVSGGPAYQRTQFDDVVPGDPESEETPALVVGTTLDIELNKSIDFYYTYSFQITNEQSGSYNHHMVTAFEFEITSLLDFDIQWVWDRIKDPRQNSDTSFPKSDDLRLIVGIGFDF